MFDIVYIGNDFDFSSKLQMQMPSTRHMDYSRFTKNSLLEGIYMFDGEAIPESYRTLVSRFSEYMIDPHMIVLSDGPPTLEPVYAISPHLLKLGYSPVNVLNKNTLDQWVDALQQYRQGEGPLTDATHEFKRKKKKR